MKHTSCVQVFTIFSLSFFLSISSLSGMTEHRALIPRSGHPTSSGYGALDARSITPPGMGERDRLLTNVAESGLDVEIGTQVSVNTEQVTPPVETAIQIRRPLPVCTALEKCDSCYDWGTRLLCISRPIVVGGVTLGSFLGTILLTQLITDKTELIKYVPIPVFLLLIVCFSYPAIGLSLGTDFLWQWLIAVSHYYWQERVKAREARAPHLSEVAPAKSDGYHSLPGTDLSEMARRERSSTV